MPLPNRKILVIFILPVLILVGCDKSPSGVSTPSISDSNSIGGSSAPASTPNPGLTTVNVERAVADLLNDWRMGGSVSGRGIQVTQHQN